MSVLVLGANGQLGQALKSTGPSDLEVIYAEKSECDLTDATSVRDCIDRVNPDYIINCAAYTAVDKAEEDVDACYRVNRDGVQHIVDGCANRKLIHISTDFVFDGKQRTPYQPEDSTGPLGVYGESKLAGEQAAMQTIPDQVMIIRTAWLYYTIGANFVNTMLRLISEREELNVVNDQRGAPTYAGSLAKVIWNIIAEGKFAPGVYHWTDAGEISWYDFAAAIQEDGLSKGLLKTAIPITPISTAEYPTPASRPSYSVLDTTKLEALIDRRATPWRENLDVMLTELQ
jgi:dTDP-4-dehydrorhamnose reductase